MKLREAAIQATSGGSKPFRHRGRVPLEVCLTCVVSLPLLAAEAAIRPTPERPHADVLAEFHIERRLRPIFVPVRIQQRQYLFILDTGLSSSSFDLSLRRLLGEPLRAEKFRTPGGDMPVEFFAAPEAFVGELDLRVGGPIICSDLEGIRRVVGRDIRGVLGMSFLKHYVVRIDFDAGKLQFQQWDGRRRPEWGSPVHLHSGDLRDGPYAKARLPGLGEISFLVDSGQNVSLSLMTPLFEQVADTNAPVAGLAETIVGTRERRARRVGSLGFGGFDHRGLISTEETFNLIGLGILTRHVVTFDFPGMTLYLQKGQAFDQPEEYDMSGLHLWCIDERILVHSVDKDSPAWTAGIRPEDVVLKVGNERARTQDIFDIRALLKSGDGAEIKLTLKRGTEEKVVSVRIRKRF